MITRFTVALIALSLIAACQSTPPEDPPAVSDNRPNIVFIHVDDMGYGDIGCYGAPDAKTPFIDNLAAEGVKFTHYYSNGNECTPTRTAFMTGRYQHRVGGMECAIGTGNVGRYDDAIKLADNRNLGLPVDQTVIPSSLKQVGYRAGLYGKWHLGYEPKFNPLNYGFDDFFGCLGGNVDYFTHRELSDLPVLYKNRRAIEREGYMTHLTTDEALDFIDQSSGQPFFLYIAYTTPHFPYQGPGDADLEITRENFMTGTREKYVEMLEDMDSEVGRVVRAIDMKGIRDNTVIVYASDNGGTKLAHHGVFSGHKSGTMEGGIRVPLIVRWPNRIRPGTVSEQMAITMDLTRSFLRIAGGEPKQDLPPDGIDIIDHIENQRQDFKRTFHWRDRRGDRTWWAINDGRMKYIKKIDGDTTNEWLFNLHDDPGEKNNLYASHPEVAADLKTKLTQWEADVQPNESRYAAEE